MTKRMPYRLIHLDPTDKRHRIAHNDYMRRHPEQVEKKRQYQRQPSRQGDRGNGHLIRLNKVYRL